MQNTVIPICSFQVTLLFNAPREAWHFLPSSKEPLASNA
jgi:hypothetical protein